MASSPPVRDGREAPASRPSPLVIDIETVGLEWTQLQEEVRQYLLERVDEERREEVPQRLGLHPATGRIIAIGLWRPEEDRGGVLVEARPPATPAGREGDGDPPSSPGWGDFEDGAKIYRGSEREILQEFWRYVAQYAGTIITFNGRTFDGPFLMLRSAILGIAPSRNLVPFRYSFQQHCDLLEVLTFFRARPADSLDFWCRQFGVPSPKDGMDGAGVETAYKANDMDAIARYCLRDVRATAELYRRLKPVIDVMDGGR